MTTGVVHWALHWYPSLAAAQAWWLSSTSQNSSSCTLRKVTRSVPCRGVGRSAVEEWAFHRAGTPITSSMADRKRHATVFSNSGSPVVIKAAMGTPSHANPSNFFSPPSQKSTECNVRGRCGYRYITGAARSESFIDLFSWPELLPTGSLHV